MLSDLRIERVFRLEGITDNEAQKLSPLFCHEATEILTTSSTLSAEDGSVLEVGYQRAVTDPELPSVIRGAKGLGVDNLEWVRIATRYQFSGISEADAERISNRYLYNPQVQVMISPDEDWDTLKPRGETGPVKTIPLRTLTTEELTVLSEEMRLFLNADQMNALKNVSERMGRDLTDGEVEMFAQTWSDHCFHTTWKSLGLLQMLWKATNAIGHPLVLSVFEDNAGAVSLYDGWALTIKGETHNSPSAISPYGGIMTKHGGVIRDTLGCGQGAWPIGGSTVMGIGDPRMKWDEVPEGALHPETILLESIRGTADYSNPMGIPMMFPVYRFHNGYTGKCFALGHSIGLLPADRARKGRPESGDFAVLIGGLTGRDGLHGATVSSGSMTSETAVVDAAHVQIGQPIEERKFMEAIPVLRDRDCLRAITDLGAAGLSSAAGEMGEETGIWINLANVPLKTEGMHPWEIWISESQERMFLCVPPEKLDESLRILDRYEVPSAIVGKFTESHRCQVVFDESPDLDPRRLPVTPDLTGEIVIDLDFHDLRKGCPLPEITLREPEKKEDVFQPLPIQTADGLKKAVENVLGHLNICDQSPAGTQFDNTIQGNVVVGPYGGEDFKMPDDIWLSAPVRGKTFGAAASVAFNPFYSDVDPAGMAGLMVIESISRLVAAGVDPGDIVLCDNFYTPRVTPEIAWHLKKMVETCCTLSREFGTPFISGKDSSSGTFIGADGTRLDIPPTLAVMAMGRMADARKHIPKSWRKKGSRLIVAGPLSNALGGSVFYDTLGHRGSRLPQPAVTDLKILWQNMQLLQNEGKILSSSAIGEGGLIRRIFEMALGSGLGCRLNLSEMMKRLQTKRPECALFAEMTGAVLLEVDDATCSRAVEKLNGVVVGETLASDSIEIAAGGLRTELAMKDLIAVWEKLFKEIVRS